MTKNNLTLNEKVLLAALEVSGGNISKEFTAEDLLIKAWKLDKSAFGLRGYEKLYPDSNILYTKLMGKSGLVRTGYLKKVGEKTYTITEAGLAVASRLKPTDGITKIKIDRQIHDAVIKIINHNTYNDWRKGHPINFKDAMWFWRIAPGNPPKIIKERISVIENTLVEAIKKVEELGGKFSVELRELNESTKDNLIDNNKLIIDKKRGYILIDVSELNNCLKFHNYLLKKFKDELDFMMKKR